MDSKVCSTCKESKHLDEYHVKKRNKDGRQARCRVCMNEYQRGKDAIRRERYREWKAEGDRKQREL